MQGRLLDYSVQSNSGVVSGDDGNRYRFTGDQWKESGLPRRGMRVDFEARDSDAVDVYAAIGAAAGVAAGTASGRKDRVAAGVLGICLGGLGIHKFYLGYNRQGVIHLAIFFGAFILIGIPTIAISVIGLVEGIIYISKSDEEFEQTYVYEAKEWF